MSLAPRIDKLEKNAIINGNFDFWQRGTSFTTATSHTADRWICNEGLATGTANVTRSTDVPTVASTYSFLLTTGTTQASPAAGEIYTVQHKLEGGNFLRLAGKIFTVSFYVKTSIAGTYAFALRNSGVDRSYVTTYTTATTGWEYKTIVIPASPAGGTWNYTNGVGLIIDWVIGAGSSFVTASPGSWISANAVNVAGTTFLPATAASTFQLAQVMINEGGTAGSFSTAGGNLANELVLCQRYYEKSYSLDVAPGTADFTGGVGAGTPSVTGGGDRVNGPRFAVQKRATPTVVNYNPNSAAAPNSMYEVNTGAAKSTTGYVGTGSTGVAQVGATGNSLILNNTYIYQFTADAEL